VKAMMYYVVTVPSTEKINTGFSVLGLNTNQEEAEKE
jgi:hypothetical protein